MREAHADAFGYACMLLRAENRQERAKNTIQAYRRINSRFWEGYCDNETQYGNSLKYYADFYAQRATVKEVNRWYIRGDVDKYRNGNGDINFDALATKIEEIVSKNAMSPYDFYNFLNDKFLYYSSLNEKGWRGAVPRACLMQFFGNINNDYKKMIQKLNAHEKIDVKKWETQLPLLEEYDENTEILNTCCQLNNLHIKFAQIAKDNKIDIKDYKVLSIENALAYGKMPSSAIKTFVRNLKSNNINVTDNFYDALTNYQKSINNVLHYNAADIKTVINILHAANDDKVYNLMWKMYNARRQNPSAPVDLKQLQPEQNYVSTKKIYKKELQILDFLKKKIVSNEIFDNIASSPAEAMAMREKIINNLQSPRKFERDSFLADLLPKNVDFSSDCEEQIKATMESICALHFAEKDVFERTVKKYMTSLHNLNNKSKSAIKSATKNSCNER